MLTIVVNVLINNQNKLAHFKYSLNKLDRLSDNWLINIRGNLRKEATEYTKKLLQKRAVFFSLLDDEKGWIPNALNMLEHTKYDYILLFNEDHALIAPHKSTISLIRAAQSHQVDYLPMSWWHFGKYVSGFDVLNPSYEDKDIRVIQLDKKAWFQVLNNQHDYYLISEVAIFRKSFLVKMLQKDAKKLPLIVSHHIFSFTNSLRRRGINVKEQSIFQFINRLVGYKLKRYESNTPFEIEKDPSRLDMLPFVLGLPKREILACIDTDHGCPDYQLIKRGLYP